MPSSANAPCRWRARSRCAAKWDGQRGSRWKISPGTASFRRSMTPTRAPSPDPQRLNVGAAAVYVLTHPWEVFITDCNWKTAVLSAIFRVAIWPTTKTAGVRLVSPGAMRILLIEFAYLLGLWGSLIQAFA